MKPAQLPLNHFLTWTIRFSILSQRSQTGALFDRRIARRPQPQNIIAAGFFGGGGFSGVTGFKFKAGPSRATAKR